MPNTTSPFDSGHGVGRFAGVATVVASIFACAPVAERDEWAVWRETAERTRVAAALFPEAASVKVYSGGYGISFDRDGRTQAIERGSDYRLNRLNDPPAKGSLAAEEIAVLHKSVFYALPPPAIAACCIPRHAFAFYAADGRYLGNLAVSFECVCAVISPANPPDPARTWVLWDTEALERILDNHGVAALNPQLPAMGRPGPS